MKFIQEFKEFASKGNVLDLAVGVIIGAAFGKIVTSFVNDIMMPPIGYIIQGVDFKSITITLKEAEMVSGKIIKEAVTLKIGSFIQAVFDFTITAFAIFAVVKTINKLKKKEEPKTEAPQVPTISKEEQLLTEIRDLLKNNKA